MSVQEIPINNIQIIENYRTNIDDTELNELMSSIKQHGLKQPIGVYLGTDKKYKLIFGARRLLACKKLGWSKISAQVDKDISGKDHVLLNLTENIQRKNPSFIELGRGIEKLSKMKMTNKEIAVRLGIPDTRVIQILEAYTMLPAKHREKVKFMGTGGKRTKGTLPAQIATKIIRIKKDYGLDSTATDALIAYVTETKATTEILRNLALLLNAGLKIGEALEKMEDYSVYSVEIIAHRLFTSKRAAEGGHPSVRSMLKKILYGEAKGLEKPSFIKI